MIHCELNRIHSHLVWLGTSALDLGAISIFWYCFRERDKVLDLFEYSSGQRMHTRYVQVGGVIEDIPAGWAEKALAFTYEMEERVGQYEAILDRNEIFLQRTKDVGIVPSERLLELGVTGPLLRAAGNPWDLRKAAPYSPTTSSTSASRSGPWVTATTAIASGSPRSASPARSCARRSRDCRKGPSSPRTARSRCPAPRAGDLDGGADPPLQAGHRGLPGPAGEAYEPIEGPRGELGCFVSPTAPPSPPASTCATPRS